MERPWSVRDGEEIFFDSHEELPPESSPGAALPWHGGLRSVRERRERFVRTMGLECNPGNRVDSDGDGDGVDNHGAAAPEIARASFSDENGSDCSTSSSSSEKETSSGSGATDDDSASGDYRKDRGREESMSISTLSFVQRLLHGDGKPPSGASMKIGRRRHGWLGRLGMVACTAVDNGGNETSTSSSDSDHDGGRHYERIKVRSYRKQVKEFSAVYRGQVIKAHDGAILTVKFSPDGELLATGGEDGVVRVWCVTQAEGYGVPTNDPSCIYLKIGDESQLIPVEADEKKKCKVKSVKKSSSSACVVMPEMVFQIAEEPLHELHGHSGGVLDLSWSSSKRLLSASTDKTVRLWEIGCANCIAVFPHSNFVTCVQLNPANENCFISGSIDGKIRVWDIARCRVLDWADVREIVTAICYRPDGKGAVVGTITGNCRFYDASDNVLRLESQITLNRKSSSLKRVTGLQFCPIDPRKLMVTSADSKISILDGADVIQRYGGLQSGSCQLSATFTPDGQYIISASGDSDIYIWNHERQDKPKQVKTTWSSERFPANNAAIAIPWNGTKPRCPVPFASQSKEFFLESSSCKSSATWPEEMLPICSSSTTLDESQRKLLRSCCQGESHSWGQVIVTAGWDGRIRSFQNYGLPVHQ